ncbi:unnamed protein product [Schistosoma curassoni]|uniref:Conjugal transfer protein TraR n=1 Tax=Schistosoma curassoni TaxID=6186 RepID=A0A183JS18_9TREM|nr:unnamed protein product [Schistosoma curassoni]
MNLIEKLREQTKELNQEKIKINQILMTMSRAKENIIFDDFQVRSVLQNERCSLCKKEMHYDVS